MKQTFGNLLKLFLLSTIPIFATVKASLNASVVYEGDIVNFTITAEGKQIDFPKIQEIDGVPIVRTSSTESITVINGKMQRETSKIYQIRASKPLKIPSFKVIADGKEYETDLLELKVLKPTTTKQGSQFMVELSVDKNESYVGEAINLTISFKSKINARADQIQLGEPKLENFWVKKNEKVNHSSQGEYIVQSLTYKLFPQKAGTYTIPIMETLVGQIERRRQRNNFFNDPFFNGLTQKLNWQKIYSNSLKLTITPLPEGLELYGNYQIQASVDSQRVQANKPVNLTLSVKGEGNIDDVKKFDLSVNNVIIYADDPQISSKEIHEIYQGLFKQKIVLIADQNFTIPSLSLKFFDKKSKKVKTVTTKPIEIEIMGSSKMASEPSTIEVSPSQILQAPKEVEREVIIEKEDAYLKYLFLAIGFIAGVVFNFIINKIRNRSSTEESNIIKAIKNAKDDRILFTLLLPHAKSNHKVREILNQLEENLYRSGTNKIDKELLMEIFEEI